MMETTYAFRNSATAQLVWQQETEVRGKVIQTHLKSNGKLLF